MWTHQCFPVLLDEVFSGRGPARQQNIGHSILRYLQLSQIEAYNNEDALGSDIKQISASTSQSEAKPIHLLPHHSGSAGILGSRKTPG